jgi:hypothetical protein
MVSLIFAEKEEGTGEEIPPLRNPYIFELEP